MNTPHPLRRLIDEAALDEAMLRDLHAHLAGSPDGWVMSGRVGGNGVVDDTTRQPLRPLDEAMEAALSVAGGRYLRCRDQWVAVAPTRWRLREALRRAEAVARRPGVEHALVPSRVARCGEEIDFLGRRLSPDDRTSRQPVAMPKDEPARRRDGSPTVHYLPRWQRWALGGGGALYTLLAAQPLAAATSVLAPDATGSLDLDGIPPHDVGVTGFGGNCYVSRLYSALVGQATSVSTQFGTSNPGALSASFSQTGGSVPHYVRVTTSASHYGWLTIDRANCKASYWIGSDPRVTTLRPDGSGLPGVPTVSDGHITLTSAGSGTGGAYRVGDTVSVSWDNSAAGDDNSETITAVSVDFSEFGGAAAVAASNSGGVWSAGYTITEDGGGSIDATGVNVSVTATDAEGDSTTTEDGADATVDNDSPGTPTATLAVNEGVADGAPVGTVTAGGIDGVSLSLIDDAGGRFAISAGGAVSVADGGLIDHETDASHTITVRATDDAGNTTDADLTVTVNDAADPPVVDLNGASAGEDATLLFIVGDGAIVLAGAATLSEPEGQDLDRLVVDITIDQSGDQLAVGARGDGAVGNGITIAGTATSTLTLSGAAAAAEYQSLVREITFDNPLADPEASDRSITFTARDIGGRSATANATVSLNADPPVVDLNGASTGDDATLLFIVGDGAIVLAGAATLSEPEGQDLDRLVVDITIDQSGDQLAVGARGDGAVGNGITIAGTATSTLTLSGAAAAAEYQSLVREITFDNPLADPEASDRSITFTARDIGGRNATATATVSLNRAPTLAGSYTFPASTTAGLRVADLLAGGAVSAADADGDALGIAVTAVSGAGTWHYSTDNANWSAVGTPSAASALLLDENSYLRYQPHGTTEETATLTFRAWDQSRGTASTNGSLNSADTTVNGGSSAFSSATLVASLTVNQAAPSGDYRPPTVLLPAGGGTAVPPAGATVYIRDDGGEGAVIQLPPAGAGGASVTVNLPMEEPLFVSANRDASELTVARVRLADESETRTALRFSGGSVTVTASAGDQPLLSTETFTVLSAAAGSRVTAEMDAQGDTLVAVTSGDRVVVNAGGGDGDVGVVLTGAADGGASAVTVTTGAGERLLVEPTGAEARIRFIRVTVNGEPVALPGVVSGEVALHVPASGVLFMAIGSTALESAGDDALSARMGPDAAGVATLFLTSGQVSILAGGGGTRSQGGGVLAELFAGETAWFDAHGGVSHIQLGSPGRDAGWPGDRLFEQDPPLLSFAVTRLDGERVRHGGALISRLAATIAALSGRLAEDPEQDARSGVCRVRLADPAGGPALVSNVWPVSEVRVEAGPDQLLHRANGVVRIRSGNYALDLVPAVEDPFRFLERLSSIGMAVLSVGEAGEIFVVDGEGNHSVMRPGWSRSEGEAGPVPFFVDEQGGRWWNPPEGGAQPLYPLFVHPLSLHRVLSEFDPAYEVEAIRQGVLTIRLRGGGYDLIPDYALLPVPEAHVDDDWWREGERYYIHYRGYRHDGVIGWVQALRIEPYAAE